MHLAFRSFQASKYDTIRPQDRCRISGCGSISRQMVTVSCRVIMSRHHETWRYDKNPKNRRVDSPYGVIITRGFPCYRVQQLPRVVMAHQSLYCSIPTASRPRNQKKWSESYRSIHSIAKTGFYSGVSSFRAALRLPLIRPWLSMLMILTLMVSPTFAISSTALMRLLSISEM